MLQEQSEADTGHRVDLRGSENEPAWDVGLGGGRVTGDAMMAPKAPVPQLQGHHQHGRTGKHQRISRDDYYCVHEETHL